MKTVGRRPRSWIKITLAALVLPVMLHHLG